MIGEAGDERKRRDWKKSIKILAPASPSSGPHFSPISSLDDGCLMHIFSFLSPSPDRYNTALVCHRWRFLACHPRLWLRVDRSVNDLEEPGVFPSIETAVSAARPGDTILIAAGGSHSASDIQIDKPLCLIGGGDTPDETTLLCSRGSERSNSFDGWTPRRSPLSNCLFHEKTINSHELGCCLLHRSGRLTVDGCILQCESDPLDYLSFPIVSTAGVTRLEVFASSTCKNRKNSNNSVAVSKTRIEGGAKAAVTNGDLALQRVRVIYARTCVYFWFDIDHQ